MPGLVHVNRTMVAIFANINCESWLSDRAFQFKGAFFVNLVWVAGYGQTRTRPFSALGLIHQGRALARRLHTAAEPAVRAAAKRGPLQAPLHSCAEPNWWAKYGRRAASQSVRFGRLGLEQQTALNSAGSVTLCDVGTRPIRKAFFLRAEPNG